MSYPKDEGWKNLSYPKEELTLEEIKKMMQKKKTERMQRRGRLISAPNFLVIGFVKPIIDRVHSIVDFFFRFTHLQSILWRP